MSVVLDMVLQEFIETICGEYNEKGEEVVPAKYIEIYDFYDYPCPTTKVRKSKDDNWEYIDLNKLK